MSNLIDRQAAIKVASKRCYELRGVFGQIEEGLNELPTVEAIPVEWIYKWLENIPNNQRGYSEDWNYNIKGEVKKIIYKNNTVILLPCITDMLDDWMEENK